MKIKIQMIPPLTPERTILASLHETKGNSL